MAGPNWSSPSASASSSSSHRRDSGAASLSAAAAASSSGSSSQVREEEEERDREYPGQHHFHNPELENHHIGGLLSYRENLPAFDDDSPRMIRDDTWSCIIVVFTFLFFVSVTLILGVYGAVNIQFGPNCSLLIQPNPLFVQSVKVEEIDDSKPGLKLYGLYKSPYLDVVTTWSENYTATLQFSDVIQEWIHYLNRGSQVNISYNVNSASSSVFLVIAQGREGLSRWLEDPTYPNTTLSWNIVDGEIEVVKHEYSFHKKSLILTFDVLVGSGMIELVIYRSSSYYVALGNLNSEDIEVELNLTVRAYIYNTTEAYYRCTFANGVCSLSILFPQGNSIVLTSPGPEQHSSANDWSVRVSYGPRWITYIVGIASTFLAFHPQDNNIIAIGMEDSTIHIYNVRVFNEAQYGARKQIWKQKYPSSSIATPRKSISGIVRSQVVDRLQAGGLGEIKTKFVGGGRDFLLQIDDEESYRILKEQNWSFLNEVFQEVQPWSESYIASERVTRIKLVGMPLHCWNHSTFKRIAQQWGDCLALRENALQELGCEEMSILIATSTKEFIDEVVELEAGRDVFRIRVVEFPKASSEPLFRKREVKEGGMTAIMLVAFNFLNKFQFTRGDEASVRYREFASARTPLLSRKADDVSSWGSSYDSISSDEADLEDFLTGSVEGTSIGDGENSNNTKRLCAICFDAPRECFFLPCGHCVACFACGTRLAEAGGTCPICRRNMRKVRKIFTV
ncbi:RING/U-box superfamily protein, putative isoform 4 [Hibiscus syriacus]|uniref:RING/U-box superfamily protein, putative isoform 4 n=1 Tax=Hibiscus syriacus TaxID=106335 RepID=A0A6A3CB69_HIBSY|nr:RING/U-box superfamily protein, putative isoform 4 [Hibiscus syriacus]